MHAHFWSATPLGDRIQAHCDVHSSHENKCPRLTHRSAAQLISAAAVLPLLVLCNSIRPRQQCCLRCHLPATPLLPNWTVSQTEASRRRCMRPGAAAAAPAPPCQGFARRCHQGATAAVLEASWGRRWSTSAV